MSLVARLCAGLAELHDPVAATLHLPRGTRTGTMSSSTGRTLTSRGAEPARLVDLVGEPLGRRVLVEQRDDLRTTGVDVFYAKTFDASWTPSALDDRSRPS